MREHIFGASFSDVVTKKAICDVFQKYHYTLDPHGAVACLGLQSFLNKFEGYTGVFLETAHPAKFFEEIEKITKKPMSIPKKLKSFLDREKQAVFLKKQFFRT